MKKKVDYRTFSDLSDFAYLSGGEKELAELVKLYSEGQKKKESFKSDNEYYVNIGNEAMYPLLDRMTAGILKTDVSLFDISSEKSIARNAVQLETLARALETYRIMLNKVGADNYFKHLSGTKDNEIRVDMGQAALEHLDKLNAIASYYRLQKIKMEDEGYIGDDRLNEEKKESLEKNDKGAFEKERLRDIEDRASAQVTLLPEYFEKKERSSASVFGNTEYNK